MLVCHVLDGSNSLFRKKELKENHNMKPIFKTVEVQPYKFDCLVEVMVVDAHFLFNHRLEGLSIHVAGEGDRVLLSTGHHLHSENSGVEIAHVRNRGGPLIEGSPVVDNRLGSLGD